MSSFPSSGAVVVIDEYGGGRHISEALCAFEIEREREHIHIHEKSRYICSSELLSTGKIIHQSTCDPMRYIWFSVVITHQLLHVRDRLIYIFLEHFSYSLRLRNASQFQLATEFTRLANDKEALGKYIRFLFDSIEQS